MSSGGWKYTLRLGNPKLSRTAWNNGRRSIIGTPQPQDKAGALYVDVRDFPESSPPFHVPNGKEMVVRVPVRHNRDGVANCQITVDLIVAQITTTWANHIPLIEMFADDSCPHAFTLINGNPVPDFPKKPCHSGPSLGAVRPVVVGAVREVVAGVGNRGDFQRLAGRDGRLSTGRQRCAGDIVLVRDSRDSRNGHDTRTRVVRRLLQRSQRLRVAAEDDLSRLVTHESTG